jgi:hypothetical protein
MLKKLSELIADLAKVISERGDIPVALLRSPRENDRDHLMPFSLRDDLMPLSYTVYYGVGGFVDDDYFKGDVLALHLEGQHAVPGRSAEDPAPVRVGQMPDLGLKLHILPGLGTKGYLISESSKGKAGNTKLWLDLDLLRTLGEDKVGLYAFFTEHDIPSKQDPDRTWWGDTPPISSSIQEVKPGMMLNGGSDGPTGYVLRTLGTHRECVASANTLHDPEVVWAAWLASWRWKTLNPPASGCRCMGLPLMPAVHGSCPAHPER